MNQSAQEAVAELATLRDLIRWGASRFGEAGIHFGHGTDNAWDEATALALNALHLPPDIHLEAIGANLTRSERQRVVELLRRRIEERKPAPYLTGEAWFAGIPFTVDARVLVPRSPLAELIEGRFSPWLDGRPLDRVLDLGTGSGCIAIACALALGEVEVDATDVSEGALEVAQVNIRQHQVEDRVHLMRSDVYAALSGRRYDLILSNPPYVSREEMAALPPEYRHEPTLGLAAGTQGLDLVLRILAGAAEHLSDAGILIVEVGNADESLEQTLPEVPFTWIEFARGGHGVFLLEAAQLREHEATLSLAQRENTA